MLLGRLSLLGQFLGTSQGTVWWFHPGHLIKVSDGELSLQYLDRVFMLPLPQDSEHLDHALHTKLVSKGDMNCYILSVNKDTGSSQLIIDWFFS